MPYAYRSWRLAARKEKAIAVLEHHGFKLETVVDSEERAAPQSWFAKGLRRVCVSWDHVIFYEHEADPQAESASPSSRHHFLPKYLRSFPVPTNDLGRLEEEARRGSGISTAAPSQSLEPPTTSLPVGASSAEAEVGERWTERRGPSREVTVIAVDAGGAVTRIEVEFRKSKRRSWMVAAKFYERFRREHRAAEGARGGRRGPSSGSSS